MVCVKIVSNVVKNLYICSKNFKFLAIAPMIELNAPSLTKTESEFDLS